MLACSKLPNLDEIKYPKLVSTKLDGIRCIIKDGKAVSRSLKPIPNLFVQSELAKYDLEGLDGELMVDGDFNSVQSAIMSVHGEPDFKFMVFDVVEPNLGFNDRLTAAINRVYKCSSDRVSILEQHYVYSPEEVSYYYDLAIAEGNEGLILKDPSGSYKYGRSTMKQETMLKLKEVLDDEAEVFSFEELETNENEPYTNEVGAQVRSSHQSMKVGADKLGALVVKYKGKMFNIGSGFTEGQRQSIWDSRENYRGKLVKFKHLGLSAYGVPRCPIFLEFRHKDDL